MISTIKNSCRLLRVAYILSRYDALFPLERLGATPLILAFVKLVPKHNFVGRPGQRLATALTEAGPSFIKIGQALATRSDLLGEEIARDLSNLQDNLPPFPGAQARSAIETEFGVKMEDLFENFEEIPVAAASIAQVHYAITSDGQEVAVKVLRPGIKEAFKRDLELLRWLADLIELSRPDLQRLKPRDTIEKLAETVDMEMDLRLEAAAASELAENFEGDLTFVVPKVDWSRTGRCIMVTERLRGIPFNDRDALIEAGFNPTEVLTKAANATFRQVFRDGFFHADVHPGNLFVTQEGAIGAVDFGIMGRLDLKTRKILAEMLLAFLTRDYRRAAEVHFKAGWVPANRSVDAFTQACRSIAEPILDRLQNEISIARLLGQLFQITQTFEMETQPQLLLLQKTMLVAEGSARILDPKANMWFLARPLIEEWTRDNLGPEAQVRDAVEGLTGALGRLPHIIDEIEERSALISNGHVRLHPDSLNFIKKCGNNKMSIFLTTCSIAVIFLILLFLR
ncbi:MAG: 2-polyprenylphenol 6-hydroxylase [Magnetovibrio sp.]|nr:2-polyprenylphenol 6-hydroxylase [Magnetovibrio sp.]